MHEDYPGTGHERFALAAGVQLAVEADNLTMAESILALLIGAFPEAAATEDAMTLVELAGGTIPEPVYREGVAAGVQYVASVPGIAALGSVYPNPVRGVATLELQLDEAAPVEIAIYDVLGRRILTVQDGALPVGLHAIRINDTLPAGTYLVRAVIKGEHVLSRRLTVVR